MRRIVVSENNLDRIFARQQEYAKLYEGYVQRGVDKTLDPNDTENNFDQDWKYQHYFDCGADALRLCVGALIHNMRDVPKTILDLPSGHGRVARHFKAFFPDAKIVASDLYANRFEFCVKQFGIEGKKSTEHFDDLHFDDKFDLIFCGSLLSHLPEPDYKAAIRCMVRSLSDRGIALISLMGRRSEYQQRNCWQFIDMPRFEHAMSTVPATGFGYVDYGQHWMETVWTEQQHYGIAMVRPWYAVKNIEQIDEVRVLGFIERGWDDSQDVLIIGKPGPFV
jgi:SAM-dependent methyltransferase